MVAEGVNYDCADFLEPSITSWKSAQDLVITNKLVQNKDVQFIRIIMEVLELTEYNVENSR